ncbi:TPA: restriction endonuclease subunit S [Enterococcus faecium]|uniref:restriction endonuclease subunit S n=1 Tax=Enterococcus faecium TaxID=1352 RepID=UPI000CF1581D|nr:restriction endonuclease subunit S [Enterococcus faecium]MDK4463835.1 restriction endonuclease subunit S [Enterococcus faecium]NTQ20728.1 restriction endonuclease subunit S [Enterococcus faecium]PQC44440.1 restriction endonuclease subunit S [Enterococcus faecium]HBT4463241.1 restriction endonuclease subunit S [Enterococcus faecium]HBT4554305.1 restriction endonuclease subunit S [Enterococcus faecium]
MSNDTQPEIRFPGFTEAWEQRKLGEVSKIGDIDHRMPPSVDDGIPYLMTGDFIEENELNFENTKLVSEDDYLQLSKKIRPEYGDILFARYASVGAVRYVSTHRKFLISYSCAIIKPFSDIDGQFLYPTLKTQKMQQKIEFEINPNSQKNIGIDSLKKLPLFIPKMDEQQKIGTFFKQLDDTIALHQRKLDLLKETKKGFLQKMFPKNGAKVPEIRFPGFTEDWEERRLQEVVDRYDNLRIPITASKRVAGNTPYYGANGIQGYVEGYTHDGEFILVAEDGANDLKNYPVQYVDGKVWVNNHAHVIQAKENLADNMFLMNAIRSINIEPFLVGGGRAKLNADVLMKLEVIIPLKSEQQKIGAFFKQLDDTIALHQRKLDLLKETKKGFLQKMFV